MLCYFNANHPRLYCDLVVEMHQIEHIKGMGVDFQV
jgi:hypothetical protein